MTSAVPLFTTRLLAVLAFLGLSSAALAQSPIEFTGSGFFSLTAGKVLSGTHDPAADLDFACPCFVSDYGQGGVYETGGWRFLPDTRLGLQGTASMQGGKYALTGQIVARGAHGGRVNLEWLYGSVELNSNWTLQVGRKRLPLFMSSEVQDIGYALPWTHLPPQLYGWDVVNFNGASLGWRGPLGDWLASTTVFTGTETLKDAGYWKIGNGRNTRSDARWGGIAGAEAKLSLDWFEARVVALTSTTQNRMTAPAPSDFSPAYRQRLTGLSLGADDGTWVGKAEFLHLDREDDYGTDRAQLLSLGRHVGPWLITATHARYRSANNAAGIAAQTPTESHHNTSLSFKYDLGAGSALKLQIDSWRDTSSPGYPSPHGDARLLTIGYDRVF